MLKAVHEADLEILLNSDPPDSQMDRDEGAERNSTFLLHSF